MSFVINVSANGQRYFSTSRGSAKTASAALAILNDFETRFPKEEGFEVEVYEIASAAAERDRDYLTAAVLDVGFDPEE